MSKDTTKFDAWLEDQGQEVKDLIAERFSALENTVKATRTERDAFAGDLKELSKKLGKDNEATTHIDELTRKLEKAEKKASFIELATSNGCKRPSAAYTIAETDGLYAEDGTPDWGKLKESIPELFTPQSLNTKAGSGTNQVPAVDENRLLKESLSKGTVRIKVK